MNNSKNKTGTTRDGFGQGLLQIAQENDQIIGLCADLSESTRMHHFAETFPERFYQCGVAEENMVGVAAGLALGGKIPVVASYAAFCPQNAMGPIRSSVCYTDLPVKIIGGHAGVSIGPDGATHQALEDIALMRTLPNMEVVVPCDQEEARKAIHEICKTNKPSYLRTSKFATPNITSEHSFFEIGKANTIHKGDDITIIACGHMVAISLQAAEDLHRQGVSARVINMHTIKPLDTKVIEKAVEETSALITIEEHQAAGGLGSAIAEVVTQLPQSVPMKIIGVEDRFGQSGSGKELLEEYGLTAEKIIEETKKLL